MNDVPRDRVGEIVQSFVDNGERRVEALQQPDGNFTVTPG